MWASPPRALLLVAVAGSSLVAASPAPAVTGRAVPLPGPASQIGLTGATVVVAVSQPGSQCAHVRLWRTATGGLWAFRRQPGCAEAVSGGRGVAAVAASRRRALWVDYACGNICDWMLRTATPTRRLPRLLRFASREAGAPSPIVLGQGSLVGVPYAVNRAGGADLVYLGDDGAALFRAALPSSVERLAAGTGPGGRRVAVLLSTGRVVSLSGSGRVIDEVGFGPGAVRALALAPAGIVVQVGNEVRVQVGASVRARAQLPRSARVLSYASGRVLYATRLAVRARRLSTGADALLLRLAPASPRGPTLAALSPFGLTWARTRTLRWLRAVDARVP